MKSLAISYKGMEYITALEIKELLGAKTIIKDSCVIFETDRLEDLALLSYKGQAVNRVLLLLDKFKIKDIEDLTRIKKIDLSRWLKNKTFAARCEIVKNKFRSQEIEIATGDNIEGKVNLKNPDITIFVYIYKNDCYVGIDFSSDISKRKYKIYPHRIDIKGTIAYGLIRMSEFNGKGILINPFCANATICIEAALFNSDISVNKFSKDFPFMKFMKFDFDEIYSTPKQGKVFAFDDDSRNTRAAKNNAKIAGVDKFINISKQDISWLDTRFKKEEVNFIVSNMPKITKNSSSSLTEIWYKEFFNQAQYVLNKKGKIVLSCNKLELFKKYALENKFKISEEMEIEHGKEIMKILILEK